MKKKTAALVLAAITLVIGVSIQAKDRKKMLSVGSDAPSLSGVDQHGRSHTLAETKGAFTLVYFYPKDQTPGCTKEACAFRNVWEKYEKAGVKIFAVSNGSVKSHKKFADKHALPFPLIADEKRKWGNAFGVKSVFGMYQRVSFLIDKKGKIVKVYADVDAGLHAAQVLEDVKGFETAE
ncbi:MAG: peroxiredoxin [Deltaproteobacteria bacterium]|nr:peroxiredoxin [Deltaproteobacteria bacterium]MBN2671382.1 peroxiredoxin [Deltaproteobacteria bacterium]